MQLIISNKYKLKKQKKKKKHKIKRMLFIDKTPKKVNEQLLFPKISGAHLLKIFTNIFGN